MYRGSRANFLAFFGLIFSAKAQNVCSLNAEGKPAITWQTCTSSGCTTNNAQLVIDANWRWTHSVSSATNCMSISVLYCVSELSQQSFYSSGSRDTVPDDPKWDGND